MTAHPSRVLLVGGSGFIGQRLAAALLARGAQVTSLDLHPHPLAEVESVVADVRDTASLTAAAAGRDAIVNLAAAHRDDVRPLSLYTDINVGGAAAVIAAATAAGVAHITFTSTVAVYGLDKHDVTEDAEPEPFNEYGRTKLAAEELYRSWEAAESGRSVTIVRPSVVFGEGNRGNVYTLAAQIASGRFLMIGRGQNVKSMSYVGNVAEFLADTVEQRRSLTVNYADKPDLTTRELVDTIRENLGSRAGRGVTIPFALGLAAGYVFDAVGAVARRPFPISSVRVRKFVADTSVNTDRLAAIGYRPRFDLREAVSRTLAAEFPAS